MGSRKVLIVEDDGDVRLECHLLLKAHNYETVAAADGASAVGVALKQRPDLIILDLGLHAGDGFVVLDRLRSNMHLAPIPVIVVSPRDSGQNKERALKAGARAYLQKPWGDAELMTAIGDALGKALPSGAPSA